MLRHNRQTRHFTALLTALFVAALLAGCGNTASLPSPISPQSSDSYSGNVNPRLLVDVTWLSERQKSDPDRLILLDASDLATYTAGHVPGAIHAWWQDAMDPNAPAYGMLLMPDENAPEPQRMRLNFLEDLGILPDSTVVIYDNVRNRNAAKLVWTLQFLGYEQSAILDGGLGAWTGAGGSTEKYWNSPRKITNPMITPRRDSYLVKDQLLNRIGNPAYIIVDVRTDEEKRDDIDGTIELGAIPGSLSLPWSAFLDSETGLFLPEDQILRVLDKLGITPEKTIILYGRFGLESSLTWIGLKMMGFPSILLYSGGWSEWAIDPASPKVPFPAA